MNREDIIRMAREAGFREPNPHDGCMGIAYDYRDGTDTGASLERFAALVASAEREACAKVCEKFAEDMTVLAKWGASQCANAIRAKGQA